jgi:quercetin dioxygenase-like cupin family protein
MSIPTQPIQKFSDAESLAFMGATVAIRATSADGEVSLVEHVLQEGHVTPLHAQENEAEIFYVLDGDLTIHLEGEEHAASAGDVVQIPRGAAHALRADSTQSRILALSVPAGHEAFFRAAGERVEPELKGEPIEHQPDFERIVLAATATGVSILGPPPFDAQAPRDAP